MADTIQSLSLVTLAQQYRGDVVRQINRRVVLLKLLRIVPGEGKNVAWAPEADGALAENYSEGADAANFGSDAQASAVLSWGLYRSPFHVSKLTMDAAATSQSPLGNRMLWARNLVNASAKLASYLNQELYTGPGTGSRIAGLDAAIGNAGNTYAGIDRSQSGNAYFRPTVIDPGVSTPITFALLRDDIRQIYEACGENPDIALCSPSVFNKVGALFDPTRRQVQTTDMVQTARGAIKLDAGYQALEIDGTMFIKDKDANNAATPSIYYINSNHLELQYLPSANMSALPQFEVEADDGYGSVPLGFDYEMLAKQGPSERAEVLSTIQLVCNRPDSCGVRRNVG